MTVFQAKVIWPGKDWDVDEKYGGGQKTQAKFLPLGLEDNKDNQIAVNSSDTESTKAKLLKSLKKGQTVWLALSGYVQGDREKPYYDVVWFKGQGLAPNGDTSNNGEASPAPPKADTVKTKAHIYIEAYKALLEEAVEQEIDLPPDQLCMWAAGIAKQLSY